MAHAQVHARYYDIRQKLRKARPVCNVHLQSSVARNSSRANDWPNSLRSPSFVGKNVQAKVHKTHGCYYQGSGVWANSMLDVLHRMTKEGIAARPYLDAGEG